MSMKATMTEHSSRKTSGDKDKPPYTGLKLTLVLSSLVVSLLGTRLLAKAEDESAQSASLSLDLGPPPESQALATVRRYVMVLARPVNVQAAPDDAPAMLELSPVPTAIPLALPTPTPPAVPVAEEGSPVDGMPELNLQPVATAINVDMLEGDTATEPEPVVTVNNSSSSSGTAFAGLSPIPTAVPYAAPPGGGGGGGGQSRSS